MHLHWRYYFIAALLIWTLSSSSAFFSVAQWNNAYPHIAIQFDDHGMTIYIVEAAGAFLPQHTFTEFRVGTGDWETVRRADIKLSPDRQWIGFMAVHRSTRQTMLLLYRLGANEFRWIPIPGRGRVQWSPDSKSILIVPPETLLSNQFSILENAYVYHVETNTLNTFLTEQQLTFADFVWSPDATEIIFEREGRPCETETCRSVRDLYRVENSGQNLIQFTDLSAGITRELGLNPNLNWYCAPDHLIWSEFDERLYFTLNCEDGSGFDFDSLVSARLAHLDNDIRVEGRLRDNALNAIDARIIGIHPSVNGVYVSAVMMQEFFNEGYTNIVGSWGVFSTSTADGLELVALKVFDGISESPVQSSTLSLNGEQLMLGGGQLDAFTLAPSGYLAQIELLTGRVTEYSVDAFVCDMEWLSDRIIRYSQFDTPCDNAFRVPTGTWILDISSGIQTNISDDLSGFVWVL